MTNREPKSKTMKRLLTFLLPALLTLGTLAQGPTIHLGRDFGVDHINGDQPLSALYTAQQVQQKYAHYWAWAKHRGWSDAEIMSARNAEAAWQHAFWSGEGGNYGGRPAHAVNIEVPAGKFGVTMCLDFGQGVYRGQGARFHDRSGNHSYGSTHWYVAHDSWKESRFPDRIIFRSTNWGVDAGDGAWSHFTTFEFMHFDGARRTPWLVNDGKESAGIALWDGGETSTIRNCYFTDWEKDGLLLVRGTPVSVYSCSFFKTSRYGVAVIGGGKVSLYNVSGDEQGIALVGGGPGYGRPGSSNIAFFGGKHETGTSPQFRPWKGSALVHFEGWLTLTAHGFTYAASGLTPYAMIHVKPVTNRSSINITGLSFFGNAPKVLIYDEANDKEYNFPGPDAWFHDVHDLVWDQEHGARSSWTDIPVTKRSTKGRLQHVGPDGAASWATAGIYDPTGGAVTPPTPCVWTLGPWSDWGPCVAGQQTRTRTVTASPAGCTGTPPATTESRACTMQPPPPPPTEGDLPLNPADVVVVVNADDPASRAIADKYKATWGVTREVTVHLGNAHNVSISKATTARNAVSSINAKALALCFTKPSRVASTLR